MDNTNREITRIGRVVGRFTARMLKDQGVGMAEYDFVVAVRFHPGITQAEVRELLGLDKGAAARRAANLEAKGYIVRRPNPEDKRSQLLYATEKADALKESKASVERLYYSWLLEQLSPEEREQFAGMLHRLWDAAHAEFHADFAHVTALYNEEKKKLPQETAENDWK